MTSDSLSSRRTRSRASRKGPGQRGRGRNGNRKLSSISIRRPTCRDYALAMIFWQLGRRDDLARLGDIGLARRKSRFARCDLIGAEGYGTIQRIQGVPRLWRTPVLSVMIDSEG